MTRRLAGILCLLAIGLFPHSGRADFWLKPEVGSQSGTTDFELTLEQRNAQQDVKVRSLLAWPVNFMLVGLQAGALFEARDHVSRWLIEARIDTNLGDARGKMEDSDWISSRSEGLPPTIFGHTKSATDSFALLSEVTAGYRLGRVPASYHLTVDLLLGNRLEYYALMALGAQGTYLDEQGDPIEVSIPKNIEAADYTLVHVLPFIGARLVLQPLSRLRIPITARAHFLWSYSHDDHLLRNKDAFGRAYGSGVSASVAPEISIVGPLAIGLSAEVYYLASMSGVLRQEFYGDDPGTPEDERTLSVPESDFAVKSVRVQGMLLARLSF